MGVVIPSRAWLLEQRLGQGPSSLSRSQDKKSAPSGSHLEISPDASTNGASTECGQGLLYFSLSEWNPFITWK